ncbi:30S ribosomal protein S8 [Flavobacteriaceae bacterium]|nr:30S ribosomal protein S8 [Flavobacteriaceae bacterium]
MFNHSISALVSIIKNGFTAKREIVSIPKSKMVENILKVLKSTGYILNYSTDANNKLRLNIHLKYYQGKNVISGIRVVSKPGRRIYEGLKNIPVIRDGLGMSIISTSKGVISSIDSRKFNVGGEVLLEIF